ncbi:MAG: arylsulfatase [Bacteroidota bacterium]
MPSTRGFNSYANLHWRLFFYTIVLASSCTSSNPSEKPPAQRLPNIIYILADDMGYGDLQANNPESKIATPNLNRLASEGMRFLDAHAPGSVCSPTRYGILTGRYCWRSRMPRGVVRGYGPSVIRAARTTVAKLLKRKGYHTACIGKWHLGVNWATHGGSYPGESWEGPYSGADELHEDSVDYTYPVTGGPPAAGFDYSFILPASLDMKPYCYLKNNVLEAIPSEYTNGNDLNTGYTEAFWREGKIAPGFEFDQVLPTFIQEAISYVEQQAKSPDPFFLYLPLAAPHTPWVPTEPFEGTSQVGTYGDFVQMVDEYVGRLLTKLAETGQEGHTLVVFTSDNGPYWRPDKIEAYGHRSASIFRGMKADIWEGGHRVPFIARWPGKIPAGVKRGDLVNLTDLLATCAEIVGESLQTDEGPDSRSLLPVLKNETLETPYRESMIMQSSRGVRALRYQNWKYIPVLGSGGFSDPVQVEAKPEEASGQLYDLEKDPGESVNLYSEYPDKVKELSHILDSLTTTL